MKIGPNLKQVMEVKGVSAESVREALGWDSETLERVLSDRLSPGISELLRLATFLGVGIARLLNGSEQSEKRVMKTGKDERVGVDRKNLLHYESLAAAFAGRHLEPFVVDLYRREDEPDVSRHTGEEFLFVLAGELQVTVDGEAYRLEAGDSFYFDSLLPHSLVSLSEESRLVAVLYRGESMLQLTKGHGMKSLIEAARLVKKRSLVLVCPDRNSLRAVNKGIEEGILDTVYLVGSPGRIRENCGSELLFETHYQFVEIGPDAKDPETEAARRGVALVASGEGGMLMKGAMNTAVLVKAALSKEEGIGTGRRLSNVSILELPGVERLIFLTDPAINPELFTHENADSGVDIIDNAVEVARALGVERPKVALLEANEVPSEKIPTTVLEHALAKRQWPLADVSGPLSYDLALYPDAVAKKGLVGNPVAGRADILVVPHISGGNFLYKSWVFTMGAEVANVVLGARAPIILTSRSDSDLTKFLTICAGALYSHYLEKGKRQSEDLRLNR
ncbi:MAG TPA: phosphate butyryltransferase [Geobacter sp.]|nr:phosphate butyryltransferase [Geobacter sp.]